MSTGEAQGVGTAIISAVGFATGSGLTGNSRTTTQSRVATVAAESRVATVIRLRDNP